jgi:hypothetical protein
VLSLRARRRVFPSTAAKALLHKDLIDSPIVTEPTAHVTVPVAPLAPASPVEFPMTWLLEHASNAIRYRALVDVARVSADLAREASTLAYTHPPAMMLALSQSLDGTWNGSMLDVPSARAEHFERVGTINAFRRLMEYGWDKDSPPLLRARRVLFRLLAEDNDPAFLFELATRGEDDIDVARRGRAILREAAAAALAQAGYEGDPRLRGAARRVLDRVDSFLRSALAHRPWVRVGNKQVLAPEAAPPSIYALTMLAHMPLFRLENHVQLDRILHYLSQPQPRQEMVQLFGSKIIAQPHLVMGDLLANRNVADADVPFALAWLELMARLGFLRRNDGWSKLFERFLDDRDRELVWHPHKGMAMPRSTNPFVWPAFPLEQMTSGDERWTDVTFRLGLIARLSGRPLELV